MSFLRHARSIGPMWVLASCQVEPECRLPLVGTGNQHKGATEIAPLLIVRDESHRLSLGELVSTRARLRFAGCIQFAIKEYGRSRIFQRTANSVLTVCVSRGDKRMVTGPQEVDNPSLSADGAWILYLRGREWQGRHPDRLMRIPASGGVPKPVLELRNFFGFQCARAPASRCVILETSQDKKQLMITEFDPLKGKGDWLRTIEIAPSPGWAGGLSPDGSTLAISQHGEPEIHIRLRSLSGGADSEIRVKGWPRLTGLDWSPDGKGFYCRSSRHKAAQFSMSI